LKIQSVASGSAGNCYIIDDGTTALLIECGIPMSQIRRGAGLNLSAISGCIVSHEHGDHIKSATDIMSAGIEIYTSRGTAAAKGLKGHRLNLIKAAVPFKVGTFNITAFRVMHDAKEPFGFVIYSTITKETVLYLTDTSYSPVKFKNLTHIMLEINYSDEILAANFKSGRINDKRGIRTTYNHMDLETALDLLRKNWSPYLRQIWLLHLSDANSDAAFFKSEVEKVTGSEVIIA